MQPEPPLFECLIAEFEEAWASGNAPSIGSFLERVDDPSCQLALLHELVCIDLEFRWRASATLPNIVWGLEEYTKEFRELGSLEALSVALIEEEYRARKRWGNSPNPEVVSGRFAGRESEVVEAIAHVDEELRREFERPLQLPSGFEATPTATAGTNEQFNLQLDDYVLEQMIGAGQMGRVYRARQRVAKNPVAVKFLRKSFCHDRSAVERFLAEARVVSLLQHPGIIRVHGVGSTPGGGYFIVMDHLIGPDLAEVIKQGPVSVQDAVNWTAQACQAIEHSHRSGIVHCDLKPGNLILDDVRRVRVTDFGLAQSLGDETRTTDRIAGTAPFMSPEQVSGWWGRIGPQTDVYGLGAILYALLAGNAPHSGRTLTDTLAQVVSGVQPAPVNSLRPDLPADLVFLVHKCLAKKPTDRYGSAYELKDALRLITPEGAGDRI